MNAFWIILAGSLVASTCGLLGSFLVLRKISMIGDAISHSVLPGIVIAFLITGSNASIPMLIGAAAVGVLASFLIELFHRSGKLQADASIGLTFTWLFAIGVIMISAFARNVHIDAECVLYGEIAYVPLDRIITAEGTDFGPRTVWILAAAFILIVGILIVGYRGFFLTTFDPAYAVSLGISNSRWHYLLMAMVSLASVVSFESVGAILVVAMLIAPAATAYLLTEKLSLMLILSVVTGIIASAAGYFFAVWIDGSIAGAITTILGLEFLLAFIYSLMKKKFQFAVFSKTPTVQKTFLS